MRARSVHGEHRSDGGVASGTRCVHLVHVGVGDEHLVHVDEQGVASETGVPLAALGVEDPERRRAARPAVTVVGDERLRPLADDVPAQPDPRPTVQLQPDARRLVHCGRQAAAQPGTIQDEEQRLRSSGERRQAMEPIGDPGRCIRPGEPAARQVEDEHVHRPPREQRSGDRQPLVQALRRHDDEPLEPDPAGDRLDRIEAARQVEPGDDGAAGLGLRDRAEGERRPTARSVAADGDARRRREAARPEDRVEGREPGPDDPLAGERRARRSRRLDLGSRSRRRRQRQRPEDPRSCRTPSSLEARHGGCHISSGRRHRTPRLEHPF